MGGAHVLSSLPHDGVALGVNSGDCDNTLGVEDAAAQRAVRLIGVVRIIAVVHGYMFRPVAPRRVGDGRHAARAVSDEAPERIVGHRIITGGKASDSFYVVRR